MAQGKKGKSEYWCGNGAFIVTWKPVTPFQDDPQTGLQKRGYARGILGRQLTFKPLHEGQVPGLGLSKHPRWGYPKYILEIEAGEKDREEKIEALRNSEMFKQGRMWRDADLRLEEWRNQRQTRKAEYMSALTVFAKLFHGGNEKQAEAVINQEMLLLPEIMQRCNEELNRREEAASETTEAVAGAG